MTSALFGSGATAAVIASHATAASSTFQESASIGAQTQINDTITASATAIDNLPSQFTSSQVQTIYEAANSITLGVVAGVTITWGMVFGAATVVGYLGAPYASC